MEDLFEREQQIYDIALSRIDAFPNRSACDVHEFEKLTNEYGRLLKQMRRITKISDKTTVDLNTTKQDLLDKVHYDVLTGIYNRRYLEENLKRILKSLSRAGGLLSVMMLDIDFFKEYNDTYGHGMGDDCLKAVALSVNNGISRGEDFMARYGGEEFAVVLPNTDEKGARIMAKRILENVRASGISHEKNRAADHVTISIGLTTGRVEYFHNGADYIKRADQALYVSKQNGRNQYTYIGMGDDAS